MTVGRLAILGLGACVIAIRRDQLVRAIRALDRFGGLFAGRGATAYARASGLLAGLHRRVAADAAATVGEASAGGAGRTIVDLGSGPGDLLATLRRLVPAATLVGVEPSADMRAIAAERGIASLDGRAERLPLADAAADLVLSTLSSHHWDDPAAAFAEIRRVLRPDGEARIYDVRFAGYGPAEARDLARRAGFAPEGIDHRVLDERLLGVRPYGVITLRR